MYRKLALLLIAALFALLSFNGVVYGYNPAIATYTWNTSTPNYNPSASIHLGIISLTNLVTGDFLGLSSTQPNAPAYGDSGVSIGWDDGWKVNVGHPNTNGDKLDGLYVQLISPAEGWWDMGFATKQVVVFLSQDHGPYLGEGLEVRVYGSNTLWGVASGQAVLKEVFLDGWRCHNPSEDKNGNGWCSDDIAGVFELPSSYRYVKITAWSCSCDYSQPEVDAVASTTCWCYVFEDSSCLPRGTILKINTVLKLFQFIAPGKDFGVRHASYMLIWTSRVGVHIIIWHEDAEMRLYASASPDTDYCVAYASDKIAHRFYGLTDKTGFE